MKGQLSSRALFGVVYATSISSIYFALGVIAHHAGGLTPEVFIAAAIFFQLTAMTYAEGAGVHPEGRGGSPAFARYAFNELVSFIAAWSIVLDYTILIAVTALTVPAYLAVFWPSLGHGAPQLIAAIAVIVVVSADCITGVGGKRLRQRLSLVVVDVIVQVAVLALGVILVFHPSHLTQSIHLGSMPTLKGLGFALPVGVIAFSGLESAAALTTEWKAKPKDLGRLMAIGSATIILVYVGIAIVGVAALPVDHGQTALGQKHIQAPVLGIVESFHPKAFADVLKYLVGITGALVLASAAGVAQLGVSRVGHALATNRQIPSAVGRLSGRWGTPWIVIVAAALAALALVIPQNLELLVGIYAFGALIAFTIAHVSVIAMRIREPSTERTYRVPLNIPFKKYRIPLPAVLGATLSGAGWIALVIFHGGARYVGLGWLIGGVTLYVAYRTSQGKPVLKRVVVHERALRRDTTEMTDFGSILVPIFGEPSDEDSVQTASRLAGDTQDDADADGAMIEAIWVFEMPMSLALDAPLPDERVAEARRALVRAKQVGEEFEGVQVATAIVRGRRAGASIVREAQRRGVELIVLATGEPGQTRAGGKGSLDKYLTEVTRYVLAKATCRVIITTPAAPERTPVGAGATPESDRRG